MVDTQTPGGSETAVQDFTPGMERSSLPRISFLEADSSAESLGISGTHIRSKSDASDNLQVIDAAIQAVSGYRANFGSIQSRLQSTVNNLDVSLVNQEAARSRIEDVDVAESTAKLASIQIQNAAGVATLGQANQLGSAALRLIG